MNRRLPWDDLRIVQAIADAGSLSGAGRRLGLSHATVFRRLGAIETRLGVALFDRGRAGYTPTAAGEDVAAAARRIETEVAEVERRVVGQDLRPTGTVRVTTTDTLLLGVLSPVFAAFRRKHPEIELEIAVSNAVFDLAKREADVAVRPAAAPPESLVGRRIARIAQAVYGDPEVMPAPGGDPRTAVWVGPDARMGYNDLDAWMERGGLNAACRHRVDSLMGMYAAARAGSGLAVLPCYLGECDERLLRLGKPIGELTSDLWLLTHPDLRRTARVRAFTDFVAGEVHARRDDLGGQHAASSRPHGGDVGV